MKVPSKTFLLAALGAASVAICGAAFSLSHNPAVAQQPGNPLPDAPRSAPVQIAQAQKPAAEQPKEAAKPAAPKPADIDRNGTLILIRTTLMALDQANKTGNYTVLRDLGAPNFQAANTAAQLGDIFASQRRDKLDLSGVAYLDPQLTLLPQIEANGLLHMAGFYPSVPNQIKFELLFAPVAGQWKLFGIGVSLEKTGPSAPQPSPGPETKSEPGRPAGR